jgi:hypothetical protein
VTLPDNALGDIQVLLMAGVNPATFATDEASSVAEIGAAVATYPHVPKEPALRCYVTASC